MRVTPHSGEIIIGDLTLDAMTAQTVREMSGPAPREKGWVKLNQFCGAFGFLEQTGRRTMNKLIAAGKWETSGRGNQIRYRPISKKK